MSEKEKEVSLGKLFVYEFVKAGAWGIVFLIAMGMLVTTLKDEFKQGIAYGVDRLVMDLAATGSNPKAIEKFKEIIKESLDYSLQKATTEAKGILNDTSIEIKFNQTPKEGPSRNKNE
jgi:hypothetical protein